MLLHRRPMCHPFGPLVFLSRPDSRPVPPGVSLPPEAVRALVIRPDAIITRPCLAAPRIAGQPLGCRPRAARVLIVETRRTRAGLGSPPTSRSN